MKRRLEMHSEKEEALKALKHAYQRIVISGGAYETESFARILEEEAADTRMTKIVDFMKNYRGNSLFVTLERMLSYYDKRRTMRILLSVLEEAETEFYLYLFVPENQVESFKEEFELVYLYSREWYNYALTSFEDDGYIIEISDNRYQDCSLNNYFRIYPSGKGFLVTDSGYHIEKTDISIPHDMCKELISEVKKRVKKEVEKKNGIFIDDRESLKAFIVTYGFDWLGYQREWWMDYRDYFLQKSPSEIIGKIMDLPIIKEKFINAPILPEAKERFEDDI